MTDEQRILEVARRKFEDRTMNTTQFSDSGSEYEEFVAVGMGLNL